MLYISAGCSHKPAVKVHIFTTGSKSTNNVSLIAIYVFCVVVVEVSTKPMIQKAFFLKKIRVCTIVFSTCSDIRIVSACPLNLRLRITIGHCTVPPLI